MKSDELYNVADSEYFQMLGVSEQVDAYVISCHGTHTQCEVDVFE